MAGRVLGVLSGNDMPIEQVAAWGRSADVVLAADGGMDVLLAADCDADAAIGDFDSISGQAKACSKRLVFEPDQNSSDCDKLLAYAVAQGHDEITLCNLEGDMPDHVLATYHSALRSSIRVRFALRSGIGYLLRPDAPLVLQTEPGTRVSLIPILPCEGVHLGGVHWVLDSASLSPGGMTSLANVAVASAVEASVSTGGAILFLLSEKHASPSWP
jgi:thiamine pyrophosphokinase